MKKGFTLVELLGVLVVLSIILVIAVPQILTVIENSEKQKFDADVRELMEISKLHFEKDEGEFLSIEFSEQGTGDDAVDFTLEFEGEMPKSGTIYFTDEFECCDSNNNCQLSTNQCSSSEFQQPVMKNQYSSIKDLSKIDIIVDNLTSSNGKWCANKAYGKDLVIEKCTTKVIYDEDYEE